jgi:hypothetical protein
MKPTNSITSALFDIPRHIQYERRRKSAHFLRYATMGANLTQKMFELEITDPVGVHYPNYIQRALLSANVKTKQEALTFLNTLQIIEHGETRNSSNREPSTSRLGDTSAAGQNQSGRYRTWFQHQNIRYTRYR